MNNFQTIALSLILTANVNMGGSLAAIAEEEKDPDYIMDTSTIGNSENGYIRSEQMLELGALTPSALSLEGEQAMRMGGLDRALTVLQRSVEMAPMDIDNRLLYAETLEKKLNSQKDKKDPHLFNFIVKQWYYVFKKSEFVDQKYTALSHISGLTGSMPKRFEKPEKFLARVLMPEDGSVKVAFGGAKANANKKDIKAKSNVDKNNIDPDSDIKQSKSKIDLDNDIKQSDKDAL